MNHGRVESASLSIGKVARRAGIGVETCIFSQTVASGCARRFSLDRIFLAKKGHRLVVPQLALKSP
jgi:hypothetical protein